MHSNWLGDPPSSAILAWLNAWGQPRLLGGTDFHAPESGLRPGAVTTWVAAQERSGAVILDVARQGRTLLSFGVGAPFLLRLGDELLAIDGDGLYLERLNGGRSVVRGARGVGRRRARPLSARERRPRHPRHDDVNVEAISCLRA
jgi:hypothetical protein